MAIHFLGMKNMLFTVVRVFGTKGSFN